MILKRRKSFLNDFRKVKLTDKQFEKFIIYTSLLKNGKPLPKQARDHKLQGNYLDCKEFHIGGDMLIMYLVKNNEIILLRIGSHSQLFN